MYGQKTSVSALSVNQGIEDRSLEGNGKVIAGKTSGDEGAQFYGFQILFDEFGPDKNVDEAIQREVVDVLSKLPDW